MTADPMEPLTRTSSAPQSSPTKFAVLVAGGGAVGLTVALGLAQTGIATALVSPHTPSKGIAANSRTVALFGASLTLLRQLGAWDEDAQFAENLTGIRIIDATGGLLRAPEVLFKAADIGAVSFGANVHNIVLEGTLRAAVEKASQSGLITWFDARSVAGLTFGNCGVVARLDNGSTIEAGLVVGADGRGSICRKAAGIGVVERRYDQIAITATFNHQRPHHGISTEFHTLSGPCTTVPLPGRRSSLVLVEHPDEARRMLALDDPAFIAALEQRLQGLLGPISSLGPRGGFPLTWMKADRLAAQRVMLAGEAAHVIPPIGAQGLNLGLRDAGCLIDCISQAQMAGRDLGGEESLAAYQSARAADLATRMTAVDALNRSLLANLLPVNLARGLGLHAVLASPWLRARIIEAGLSPPGALPRSMRPVTSERPLL